MYLYFNIVFGVFDTLKIYLIVNLIDQHFIKNSNKVSIFMNLKIQKCCNMYILYRYYKGITYVIFLVLIRIIIKNI